MNAFRISTFIIWGLLLGACVSTPIAVPVTTTPATRTATAIRPVVVERISTATPMRSPTTPTFTATMTPTRTRTLAVTPTRTSSITPRLEVLRVEGANVSGQANLFVQVIPPIDVSVAKIVLGGKTLTQKTNFRAGEFSLPLDQNVLMMPGTSTLIIEVDTQERRTLTAQVVAKAQVKSVSSRQSLWFSFLGEGLPIIPLPYIDATLELSYVDFDWSVPFTGYTNVVRDKAQGWDAAFLLLNIPRLEPTGYSPFISSNMTWEPDGPDKRPVGSARTQCLISSSCRIGGAEPGKNWWFVPGKAKGVAEVYFILQDSVSNIPGASWRSKIEVVFPSYYLITLYTGKVDGAGTDADVFVTLHGSEGKSIEFQLDNPGDDREWGAVDTYRLEIKQILGELKAVRIRHNNTGEGPGWYLEKVIVQHPATGRPWTFPSARWLATDVGDRKIDVILDVK